MLRFTKDLVTIAVDPLPDSTRALDVKSFVARCHHVRRGALYENTRMTTLIQSAVEFTLGDDWMKRFATTVQSIAILALLLPVAVWADDQEVIDYREHIMNTLNEQSAALGQILSGAIPDDNLVAHLEAIAVTASMSLKSFEPKVPGGEAKPEVWSKWPDFSKRMNEFSQKTADIARIAKEKGKDEAVAHVLDALTCKSCHDVYREEKRK